MSQPRQVRVTSEPTRRPGQGVEAVAFFDEDGNPVEIGGGGERGPRGPEGPQGPPGDQGPAGSDGAPGADGADGFPSESDWNALVARVDALENPEG